MMTETNCLVCSSNLKIENREEIGIRSEIQNGPGTGIHAEIGTQVGTFFFQCTAPAKTFDCLEILKQFLVIF